MIEREREREKERVGVLGQRYGIRHKKIRHVANL